ncbi:hypothetical protein GF380_04155 [Candidatus Uhrbacteria bacterium]|nr:hypothetical protein [Candidatus Uhrbacteria bacterium]MBD3284278.1 hypothetical protein [Candidatus Uhrbacteria bacterium]
MKETQSSVKKFLIPVGIIILAALIGLAVWMSMESKTGANRPTDLGPLGAQGSVCGGPERFPCNPGLICDLDAESEFEDYGRCVTDEREPATVVGEGEMCDNESRVCPPGFGCEIPAGETEGTCAVMTPDTRPFIISVVPEGMELIKGSYQAPVGEEVTVKVRAVNVDTGELYLKPLWSSHSGVLPEEKIADLEETTEPNVYQARFTVEEKLLANLITIMEREDGQEAQLSINVAAQFE